MKRIIINADDFGLSKGINRGIIKAFKEGVLTSASLMVNMPAFEDAVKLIKDNPGLDVGLHVNFLRGMPVSLCNGKRTLTDQNGFFLGSALRVARGIYQGSINLAELGEECDAQIEKALGRGINVTHIDSEKHLHLINPVYEVIVKSAIKYGINKVRNINELPFMLKFAFGGGFVFRPSTYKAALAHVFFTGKKRFNSRNSIKAPDHSFGLMATGRLTLERYHKLLGCLRDGTTEIFCHPGYIDEEWLFPPLNREKYRINRTREEELKALLSPELKKRIHNLNIELINYQKL